MFYKKFGTLRENMQQILKPGWPRVNPGNNAFEGSLQWFPGSVERGLDLWEFQKFLVQHDIDQMTFDEIVFICQILWIKNQLANQVKPKNYPEFTQPVSNSNASSTNNNFFCSWI